MKKLIISLFVCAASIAAAAAPPMPSGGWYYGVCPPHNFRGHARDNETDAWKDAYAHSDLYPEETNHEEAVVRSNR